jgi:hypothetical protein
LILTSRRRKVAFLLCVNLVILVLVEGAARWLGPEPMPFEHSHRSVADYLMKRERGLVPLEQLDLSRTEVDARLERPVLVRVPRGTREARRDRNGVGYVVPLRSLRLQPDDRVVLILGGSAAYGHALPYRRTFSYYLERRLRRTRSERRIRVLNIARSGWTLASQLRLLERAITTLPLRPEAVIIYSGNNEFTEGWTPPRIGWRPWERLGLYRTLRGWIRPPRILEETKRSPFSPSAVISAVWRPSHGLKDASFWTTERALYLERFRRELDLAVRALRGAGIRVLLVAVPVNVNFYPATTYTQPITYRAIRPEQYERLVDRLSTVLQQPIERATRDLRALVRDSPDGPLQSWALGQMLEATGRHAEARSYLLRASDMIWGYRAALPTLARITRSMEGPGVAVLDTRGWYPVDRPITARADELFIDLCHLTPGGHELLSREMAPLLKRLLDPPPR